MAHPPPALTPALRRGLRLSLLLALAAPLSILIAAAHGSVDLDWIAGLREWMAGMGDSETGAIVGLRLSRAFTAFAVGGLLALAGALLQVLLRNPLADPYVLGLSGGAAAGALGAMLLGLTGVMVSGGAFAGAWLSALLVFGLSRTGGGGPYRLLLTGVIVASGWGAVVSLLLVTSSESHVFGMLFWLLGDLARTVEPLWGNLVLAAGLLAALALARPLNLLVHGELRAQAMGVPTAALQAGLYFLAALLTATAVTLAGTVGFVGLVIPHLLRLLAGADHRHLLLNAALLGGSFLVLADTAARTVLAPLQLPVGVLTALIGVPAFLYLLLRRPARC